MTHSNPGPTPLARKIAATLLLVGVGVGLLAVVLIAANAVPDYEQPPTPDRPVRLVAPTPSESALQAGVAVPGAVCSPEGARRVTQSGAVATCSYGPDGSRGGQRLEWTVPPVTTQAPTSAPGEGEPVDVRDRHYANCSEARSAGAAPLRRGRDDGYRRALDRDGDGVACD